MKLNTKNKSRRDENGSLVVYAFLAAIILGAIATVATYVTSTVKTTHRRQDYTEAYNYSEAGLMLAVADVNKAFTNSSGTFFSNIVDNKSGKYTKSSSLSNQAVYIYERKVTSPFTNQTVMVQLVVDSKADTEALKIISAATVGQVTVTNMAYVELMFGFGAVIVSDHKGSSGSTVTKANAQLGNVVLPTPEKGGAVALDGRVYANGRVNMGSIGLNSDMVSMTNYGTAKQVPDYTKSDSMDQLFDFARYIKAAVMSGNHYKSLDEFVEDARKMVFQGIVVVDVRRLDKGESDGGKGNNGHGNNEDGVDSSNPGKKKVDDPSDGVDDEKKKAFFRREDELDPYDRTLYAAVLKREDDEGESNDGDEEEAAAAIAAIGNEEVEEVDNLVNGSRIAACKGDKDDGKGDKDDGKGDKDDGKGDKDDGKGDKDDDDGDGKDDGKGITALELPKGIYVQGTLIFNFIYDKAVKDDKDDGKGDKDDGKGDKDDGKGDKDDGKGDKDDGKGDKDDGKDDKKETSYKKWNSNDSVLDGVGVYINWTDLSKVTSGDTSTFTSGYPGKITNPEKVPSSLNLKFHGYDNFSLTDDLPALMLNGGSMELTGPLNICGVVYSPNFIDIKNTGKQVQYVKGTVFGGGGVFVDTQAGTTILSYDQNAVDKLATQKNRARQIVVRNQK